MKLRTIIKLTMQLMIHLEGMNGNANFEERKELAMNANECKAKTFYEPECKEESEENV